MGKNRFKATLANQGAVVKAIDIVNHDERPPLFSLERLQDGEYCFANLDQEHKAMFAEAIFKRKNLTWNQIKQIDRHGLGTEKIAKSSIKAAIPKFITDDVNHFLAFRFHGKKPMVGYRQKDVFFILWFDHDFSLYNHG